MTRIEKITIRLNNAENKVIRDAAAKQDIGVSEYLRTLIFLNGNNGGTTTPPFEINNQ